MRTRRFLLLLPALTLILTACGAPLAAREAVEVATPPSQDPADACPVTRPQDPVFVPPEPYPPQAPYGDFWYGTADLWTALRPDGVWEALPHDEQGYGQKVFLWSEGFDMTQEPRPRLTLSGRRLDGDAPPFEEIGGTNGFHDDMGQFMLTGATIPAHGCWELTARYQKSELSFVVWVAP